MKFRIRFKRWAPVLLLLGSILAVMAVAGFISDNGGVTVPLPASEASGSVGKPFLSLRQSLVAIGPGLGLAQAQTPISCTLETTSTATTDSNWNNNSFGTAIQVSNYTELSLVPQGVPAGDLAPVTADFFRLDNAVIGARYTIQAKPDRTLNYNLGLIVYDRDRQEILRDTDTSTYFASVTLIPDDFGPYYFEIFQVSAQCTGDTYSLIYNFNAPTSTPTATPTGTPGPTATPAPQATWRTGFDQYEPNFGFNIATTIAPGLSYEMNFVPWGGADIDNDFLKIRVKPGLQLTCETSDLDPAVDPRIALYSGPSEANFITANDDIELGNFNSRVSYFSTYEGYVYILVGQGQRMAARDTVNSNYTFSCRLAVPGEPTPVPGTTPAPGQTPIPDKAPSTPLPTPTPTPQTSVVATPTPPPTVEEEVVLTFRLVTRPDAPTPTPEPNGFRTFRVLVYFDSDQDAQMGAGEGVTGFFVQVVSPDGRRELAQGYTDEQGQLSFTVPTIGTVRVLVPLLGVDRLVESSKPEVRVRIVPPTLPEAIP